MGAYTATDRRAIEDAFESVELWLSAAPLGYEYHDGDGNVSTPHDAWAALNFLRDLLLND